jgi:ankyrin repeat protein
VKENAEKRRILFIVVVNLYQKRGVWMKKFLLAILCVSLIQMLPTEIFAKDQPIKVYIDGEQIKLNAAPVIQNGFILVESQPIFQKLGLKVQWKKTTKNMGKKNKIRSIATINGKQIEFQDAPKEIVGRNFIPLSIIKEASRADINWDAALNRVCIFLNKNEALSYAIVKNDLSKVSDLLNKDANPNYISHIVYNLTHDKFIEFSTTHGSSSLNLALDTNNIELVNLLLKNGANPNFKDDYDETPLIHIIRNTIINDTEAEALIKILLDYGADPNIYGANPQNILPNSMSPLLFVLAKRTEPIGKLLIDHGFDVNKDTRLLQNINNFEHYYGPIKDIKLKNEILSIIDKNAVSVNNSSIDHYKFVEWNSSEETVKKLESHQLSHLSDQDVLFYDNTTYEGNSSSTLYRFKDNKLISVDYTLEDNKLDRLYLYDDLQYKMTTLYGQSKEGLVDENWTDNYSAQAYRKVYGSNIHEMLIAAITHEDLFLKSTWTNNDSSITLMLSGIQGRLVLSVTYEPKQ